MLELSESLNGTHRIYSSAARALEAARKSKKPEQHVDAAFAAFWELLRIQASFFIEVSVYVNVMT